MCSTLTHTLDRDHHSLFLSLILSAEQAANNDRFQNPSNVFHLAERQKRAPAAAAPLKCENNKRFDTLRRHERTNGQRARARHNRTHRTEERAIRIEYNNIYCGSCTRVYVVRAHRWNETKRNKRSKRTWRKNIKNKPKLKIQELYWMQRNTNNETKLRNASKHRARWYFVSRFIIINWIQHVGVKCSNDRFGAAYGKDRFWPLFHRHTRMVWIVERGQD